MVDPLTTLGAAVNITQIIFWTAQTIKRLHAYQSSTANDPIAFQDIKRRLPTMLISIDAYQTKIRKRHFSKKEREALNPLLEDCRLKIEELDCILGRILPVPRKDGVWMRAGKALASMTKERRIRAIEEALDRDLQVLAMQQATHSGWPGFWRVGVIVYMAVVTMGRTERRL